MESLKEILIRRDGNSPEEAEERIAAAKEELEELLESDGPNILAAEDILRDHFGLEPDYLIELIDF